jgi:hypothetical protein
MKKSLLKAGLLVAGVALVVTVMQLGSEQAQARPGYSAAFAEMFPANAAAKEAKCNVCHMGNDKKTRNAYGVAVGTALGEKNVPKGDPKIKAGIEKANGEKSAVAGKTFGDLIKEGKLPTAN